jgi:hypothetical protein
MEWADRMMAEAVADLALFLTPDRLQEFRTTITAVLPGEMDRVLFRTRVADRVSPPDEPVTPSTPRHPVPEQLAAELDAEIAPYRLGDALPADRCGGMFETQLIGLLPRPATPPACYRRPHRDPVPQRHLEHSLS